MSNIALLNQFSSYSQRVLQPSSNDELREATLWMETFRKKPNIAPILIERLCAPEVCEGEAVLITQILTWTSFRVPPDQIDSCGAFLSEFLQQCTSLSPLVKNMSYSYTVLKIRSYINSSLDDSLLANMVRIDEFPTLVTLHILQVVPEICADRRIYKGPKEYVETCVSNMNNLLLNDISLVIKFIGMCLDDSECLESNKVRNDIIETVVSWSQISSKDKSADATAVVSNDLWVESGIATFIVNVLSSFWTTDDADILCDNIPLFQACCESMNGILGLAYSSPDVEERVLAEILGRYSQCMDTLVKRMETIYKHSASSRHFQMMLESLAECSSDMDLLSAAFALMLSDTVADLYCHSRPAVSTQAIWRQYFEQTIQNVDRLQEVVNYAAEGLLSHEAYLHERFYSLKVIMLRVSSLFLSFWDALAADRKGVVKTHMELVPRVLSTLIRLTVHVEDPSFKAKKKGLIGVEFLWTPQQDEEALLLRKDVRDFFRVLGRSDTPQSLYEQLAVYEWSVRTVLAELAQFQNDFTGDGFSDECCVDFAVSHLEATLHFFSAVISGNVKTMFDEAIGMNYDGVRELALLTSHMLNSIVSTLSPNFYGGISLTFYRRGILRFLSHIGVVITVDTITVLLHLLDTVLEDAENDEVVSWLTTSMNYITETLFFSETVEWDNLADDSLLEHFSVAPFRTKQDHIGCVSIFRLLVLMQATQLSSVSGRELVHTLLKGYSPETPLRNIQLALRHIIADEYGAGEIINMEFADIRILLDIAIQNRHYNRGSMTWRSYLIFHEALCLHGKLGFTDQYFYDSRTKIPCCCWHFPGLLPAMAFALCASMGNRSEDFERTVGGILSSVIGKCTCDQQCEVENEMFLTDILILCQHSLQHHFSFQQMCGIVKVALKVGRPVITLSAKTSEDELRAFGLLLHSHSQLVTRTVFPLLDFIMANGVAGDDLMPSLLEIGIGCCTYPPDKIVAQWQGHLRDVLGDEAACISETLEKVAMLSVLCLKGPINDESIPVTQALATLCEIARASVAWCSLFENISNILKTSFEEVLSYFSSVLMVSVQEKSKPFGTISMYASFFEFCVICLRGTRIDRTGDLDTVTEILELSCNQRRDLIGIACRVFNCFLGGLINSESDDEDITSLVKYGMSMMSLSLGMLYSSDIRPSSGLSEWPIDYAAKIHPDDKMYLADVLDSITAAESQGEIEIMNALIENSTSQVLTTCIFSLMMNRELSFREKEPALRLLMKLTIFFGVDTFYIIAEEAIYEKRVKAVLPALCTHASQGNWRQFKNSLKTLVK